MYLYPHNVKPAPRTVSMHASGSGVGQDWSSQATKLGTADALLLGVARLTA